MSALSPLPPRFPKLTHFQNHLDLVQCPVAVSPEKQYSLSACSRVGRAEGMNREGEAVNSALIERCLVGVGNDTCGWGGGVYNPPQAPLLPSHQHNDSLSSLQKTAKMTSMSKKATTNISCPAHRPHCQTPKIC